MNSCIIPLRPHTEESFKIPYLSKKKIEGIRHSLIWIKKETPRFKEIRKSDKVKSKIKDCNSSIKVKERKIEI